MQVGVFGINAEGNEIIPTLWAVLGNIENSADPSGDTSTDPSLPVWADLMAKIKALEEQGIAVDMSTVEQAVREYLEANPPGDGIYFETDKTLKLEDGILSVNTADVVEKDNSLPVTSAAVHTVVGNIGAILDTI